MHRRTRTPLIESIAPEAPKFTAPLLLVHGLWCSAAVWRPFMGYFAHRGWTCHALTLRGHAAAPRFADYLDDVRAAMATCEAPPVIIGHDLGGLLALHCAGAARAVVALAPIVPRPLRATGRFVVSGLRARLTMWAARSVPPPRGKAALDYFGPRAPEGTTAGSAAVVRELRRADLRFVPVPDVPTLLLVGEADMISTPADVERLAAYAGASLQRVERVGHGLPWNPGWERRVGDIHRWLIQQLGEPLLVPRDEDDE